MERGILAVQTESLIGADHGFNAWYDEVHVPELNDFRRTVVVEGAVVGTQEMLEAQRVSRLNDNRPDAAQPHEVSVPVA